MTTVLSFIFVLGVLIFFHELGHFLVAKRIGVRVERFSLGFPPHIFSKQWGETTYSIGLIPLGGYVKMAGENPEDEHSGAPNEFTSKPIGQRAAVLIAGPLMNYLLAIVVLIGIYWIVGVAYSDDTRIVIGQVAQDSPASRAGLLPEDQIIKINDQPVNNFDSMRTIVSGIVDAPISLTWVRGADTLSATTTTRSNQVPNEDGSTRLVGEIGVSGKIAGYKRFGLFESIKMGFVETHVIVWETLRFIKRLITFQVSWKMVGGPVEIARLSGEYAERGASSLMFLLAVLSVNLAVLNIRCRSKPASPRSISVFSRC
jgi:regulator of sigma E protease